MLQERYQAAAIDDFQHGPDGFFLTGTMGGERFYERAAFSCGQRKWHAWLIVFPEADKELFERLISRIKSSVEFKPRRDGGCRKS